MSFAPWARRALRVAAVSSLCMVAVAQAAGGVSVDQAWSRATVAGQRAGGAFMALHNTGPAADRLLGGSTPAAERVELHTMAMEGDVMRMRELPAIELPAGQTVMLQPGKLHLMLMGLKAPLKAGDTVPLTLNFEKAGAVQVQLPVQAVAPVRGASAGAVEHQHKH